MYFERKHEKDTISNHIPETLTRTQHDTTYTRPETIRHEVHEIFRVPFVYNETNRNKLLHEIFKVHSTNRLKHYTSYNICIIFLY